MAFSSESSWMALFLGGHLLKNIIDVPAETTNLFLLQSINQFHLSRISVNIYEIQKPSTICQRNEIDDYWSD
jgi:hypothetical protein